MFSMEKQRMGCYYACLDTFILREVLLEWLIVFVVVV